MSKSPAASSSQPSVFDALGSYADRIKNTAWQKPAATLKNPTPAVAAPLPASKSAPASGSTSPGVRPTGRASTSAAEVIFDDSDEWETVPSGRKKNTGKEKGAWTDKASKERFEEERRAISAKPPQNKANPKPGEKPRTSSIPAHTTKPAWGLLPPSSTTTTHTQAPLKADRVPPVSPTSAPHMLQGSPSPSSPSLLSTAVTAVSPSSPHSPRLSAAASSTAATSVIKGKDDDESVKSDECEMTPTTIAQPHPDRQTPVRPAVNAWVAQQPAVTLPALNGSISSKPATTLQFGSLSTDENPIVTNNNPDIGVTVAKVQRRSVPTAVDDNVWPDVARAAEVIKAAEEKKERPRRNSLGSGQTEEQPAGSKKQKWVPIPPSELAAAAEAAAEARRKQQREAKRRVKGESVSQPGKTRGGLDVKKVPKSEIRLPPLPKSQTGANGFKPIFGTVTGSSNGSSPDLEEGKAEASSGSISAPVSRQNTRNSRRGSTQSRTQGSSPVTHALPLNPVTNGPATRPVVGTSTAPLPQHSFNPASNPNLPRARGRDGRASFSGRGRGGFRSHSLMGGRQWMSPEYMNAGMYPGYAMGYPPFYPMGYSPPGPGPYFDPIQAQMYGMPMWNTPPGGLYDPRAPPLDGLQGWLYGQVEYYFSMQNLAMDDYLRRQMDSEGWISIATIASFNRIKAATSDVDMVRMAMQASPNLEVREGKVRLRDPDMRRQWILPSAEPSRMPPLEETGESHIPNGIFGLEGSVGVGNGSTAHPRIATSDVEHALMKSTVSAGTRSIPPSSTASVLYEESVDKADDTPATSMSGERHEEEHKGM
ncbi:hypothetical protein TREMEDRAFT_73252 [Tremella mesenterica DSM 1558]|uniref:uncharacterized protein n=1 Tax=Tremella mesenterica (strain ATCC 24925 / CBS 8224 / DSM 1558 / NBRC 9311 / NRRL Y-6157 / RJB 2259-6 / UBC 559-6) TaxID=578456 RepID=UPI0003F4A1A1|nr:uncharacterized protein TREMEDRAFT_73252 [Tremella mesenterica DSM 1558]EIW71283.1 hypothetical protein TREMEDRAFT_73252 [Tremella mesenterica DSM 1558]